MQAQLAHFRRLAQDAVGLDSVDPEAVRLALLIREVEQKLLELFSQGRMNGTVHTCVGQEFSAVAVAGQLQESDWVTSNHRCHGHFIAKTGNWKGLLDELMGLKSGVCKGIGSSQHLFAPGFLSNGPQAALVPVGTGIALHHVRRGARSITVSFIGEGTLGEGVLYESMNLASLLGLPQLFVCENNLYSQSTPQHRGVAGSIQARAQAFGIEYFEASTWDVPDLMAVARRAIDFARENRRPAFLLVRTYRLNAHSKSDDDRDRTEVDWFTAQDPLNRLLASSDGWRNVREEIHARIHAHILAARPERLESPDYVFDQLPRVTDLRLRPVVNEKVRMSAALNAAYRAALSAGAYMIGEDIEDPYGGAFKVTKGLSTDFPDQVLGTPISEAGITGLAIGLALMGAPAYVEIMFGDFVTNIFDQLISNASKFFHMYAFRANVPLRVRTPMGGKRGYGPTHSQSLEKFLVGIDNLAVFAVTSLEDPRPLIEAIDDLPVPAVVIENKVDYGRHLWQGSADYRFDKQGGALGTLIVSPVRHDPTVTVVTYGENAREIAEQLEQLFLESDHVVELIVPVMLHPLTVQPILDSARRTRRVVVVEDGSIAYGIGSEILAQLAEAEPGLACRRLGAEPVPIPSVVELERELLPSVRRLAALLVQAAPAVEIAP